MMALPTRMTVRGRIEWNGREDSSNGGVRTVNLDNLNLRGVVAAVKAARAARHKLAAARPRSTYRHVKFDAKVRRLRKTKAGRAKLDAIARPKAVEGWAKGKPPTKANRERVEQAYADLAQAPVREARSRSAAASHAVAEALTDAVRRQYGAEVRFRDITKLSFN